MEKLLVLCAAFYAVAILIQVMCGASALKKAKAQVQEDRAHAELMTPQRA